MRKLPTGLVVLDIVDIILLAFSAGSGAVILIRNYWTYTARNTQDSIISKLKEKSPIRIFSRSGKSLKFSLVRGGDGKKLRTLSLLIKNKGLIHVIKALVQAKRTQK